MTFRGPSQLQTFYNSINAAAVIISFFQKITYLQVGAANLIEMDGCNITSGIEW